MARNSKFANVNIDDAAGVITFSWADGTKSEIALASDVSDHNREYAAFHGVNQRLRDSYAGAETLTEAQEKFAKVAAALRTDTWNARGEGGEAPLGLAVRFVQMLAGRKGLELSAADAKAKWSGLSDEQKKSVKSSSDFVNFAAEEARKKAKDVDAAAALGF